MIGATGRSSWFRPSTDADREDDGTMDGIVTDG
jgi:hypothetical protein